jgi:hypothetical protein
MRRSDAFKQLADLALQQRIVEVNELYQKMSDLVAECPEELLFDTSKGTPYVFLLREEAEREYPSSPLLIAREAGSKWSDHRIDGNGKVWSNQLERPSNMPTPSLIQQANIYVTQVGPSPLLSLIQEKAES